MNSDIAILCVTALCIGVVHTILGPDHYIPFVAMARSGAWSIRKTFWVTLACGVGHVAGSVVIGVVGLAVGAMVMQLETLESWRGGMAAWMLIAFGTMYLTWGIVQAVRNMPHTHLHAHADGTLHCHLHTHDTAHLHVHEASSPATLHASANAQSAGVWAPWLLFLVFIFGPCEPLIPLLMFPAAKADALAVVLVITAFSVATVGTMTAAVLVMRYGFSFVHVPRLSRFGHAFTGLAILTCGMLVKFGL